MLPAPHGSFEQLGAPPAKPAPLDGLRLFDGPPGEENATAPVELAPDSSKSIPSGYLNDYTFGATGKILMVCTYRGTDSYFRNQLPAPPKRCSVRHTNHETIASCE